MKNNKKTLKMKLTYKTKSLYEHTLQYSIHF